MLSIHKEENGMASILFVGEDEILHIVKTNNSPAYVESFLRSFTKQVIADLVAGKIQSIDQKNVHIVLD